MMKSMKSYLATRNAISNVNLVTGTFTSVQLLLCMYIATCSYECTYISVNNNYEFILLFESMYILICVNFVRVYIRILLICIT